MKRFIIQTLAIAIAAGAIWLFIRPSAVSSENTAFKCGDGVCDDRETENPLLCPQDCRKQETVAEQQPATAAHKPERQLGRGRCGDGICDEKEKANSALCPKDCEKSQADSAAKSTKKVLNVAAVNASKDSPFGIFGVYEWKMDNSKLASTAEINNYLRDLGVKWIQEMYFTEELDHIPDDVNIYSRVGREAQNVPPDISQKYKDELRKVIRQHKGRIKYWEVSTEPNGFPPPAGWSGHPKEYAAFLKATYEVIKSECSDCRVVLGGLYGIGAGIDQNSDSSKFLSAVLEAGGAPYFDVFEFKQHCHRAEDYLELKNKLEVYGKILAKYGLDPKKIPIFLETAMYDGSPRHPRVSLTPQTEAQQASGLLKTYILGIASGIDRIFWDYIIERHNFGRNPSNPFNSYGLVHNSMNDGKSQKKLSYYTYKKMVEVLEGSDWKNVQTIQDKNGIHIYKFLKNGRQIFVVWNDNKEVKTAAIAVAQNARVNAMRAIPANVASQDSAKFDALPSHVIRRFPSRMEVDVDNTPLYVLVD